MLQRKIANVLLFNAYNDLLTKEEHQIRILDLAEYIGFDSNDRGVLKDATRALMRVVIEWNILDDKGREGWGASPFLAQARVDPGSPFLVYAYSPDMRRKLFNPEIYARINLSVQREFRSGYALALYEQCVRFRVSGTMRSTGWRTVAVWRRLLGVRPGQYGSFKELRRRVIDKAVREINKGSDILIATEYRKEKRRIVEIRFSVTDNPQQSFKFDVPEAGFDEAVPRSLVSALHARLMTFGLSDGQASRLVEAFDEERIGGNLDYIEQQLEAGREIKNIPGFTIKAVEDDYRPHDIEIEDVVGRRQRAAFAARRAEANAQRERDEQERREAAARAARLEGVYASLTAAERLEMEDRVLDRMKREVRFAYVEFERDQRAGKTMDEMSVVVRSTYRSLRNELLESMEGLEMGMSS